MRILLFFDLPTETARDRREYTKFRKFLIKSGFFMLQKSLYCKIALNQTAVSLLLETVRRNRPKSGIVQSLVVTEKQFSRMEYIVGFYASDIVNSNERFIEL